MQEAVVKNASDRKQVKDADRKTRDVRKREMDDLRFILQTDQGRRFLWRYLGKCGVYESSFTGSSETFFKEGKRQVGLELLRDITEAQPEAYLKMMKEMNGMA